MIENTEQSGERESAWNGDEISRLYHAGASLSAIVHAVGTDPASVRLIALRLGLSRAAGSKLDWAVRRARDED